MGQSINRYPTQRVALWAKIYAVDRSISVGGMPLRSDADCEDTVEVPMWEVTSAVSEQVSRADANSWSASAGGRDQVPSHDSCTELLAVANDAKRRLQRW
jgi:hypothetical protein